MKIWIGCLIGAAATALAVAASLAADGYQAYVIGMVGLTAIVGVGLNMLMGLTGQISVGHSGFYVIGVYTTTLLVTSGSVPFWGALAAGAVLAGAAGWLIGLPTSRLSGPYVAMVTIAFAFVVENVIKEWESVTGGSSGIAMIPPVPLLGAGLDMNGLAALICVVTAVALLAFWALKISGWGLAMRAVKDSEVAASSIGLSGLATKSVGFALGGATAAVAGGFYGPLAQFVNPESFPLTTSIIFVLVVMAGGTGTVLGPLVGALIAVLLPEFLAGLEAYRLLFVGALLLTVLLIAPRGIVGTVGAWFQRPHTVRATRQDFDLHAFLGSVSNQPLNVNGLSIRFGQVQAANAVDMQAQPGRVTSLIGPNGAGKTTVLNLISGFYQPDAGAVWLGEQNVTGLSGHRLGRAGVARTFQTAQLFDDLSVLDNVRAALLRGRPGVPFRPYALGGPDAPGRATAEGLLAFTGYTGSVERRAGDLPHVDRRLVEIARALALRPSVLLLDEPAAGLNQDETRAVSALVRRLADVGLTVVVVEHDMDLVMGISDHVVVMDSGQVIAADGPARVQDNDKVRAAYLGEGSVVGLGREKPWDEERDSVLNVTGLTAGYGAAPVIEDISLRLNSGEMVAVLGANGAGKTTLMAALTGLLKPTAGSVEVQGHDITGATASQVVRYGIALVPEGRQVFPELSVRDNIALGGYAQSRAPEPARIESLLQRFPVLNERAGQRAGLLSGGEQQMLAIARGLIAEPRVLLLDEPSLGLAPRLIDGLYRDLAQLRDEGVTILLVDQMAEMALSVADRGLVLESGHVVARGTADELIGSGVLSAAYLGAQSEAVGQ